mmetsp:Transcript_29017/g.28688  ORF Transcript_29017/g.28688 Transcript_29017/m.28688 type:complete len:183 (-) Transcript_29017:39-587(-)
MKSTSIVFLCLLGFSFAFLPNYSPEQFVDPEVNFLEMANEVYAAFYKEAFGLNLDITVCGDDLQEGALKVVGALNGYAQKKEPSAWIVMTFLLGNGIYEIANRVQNCEEAWPVFEQGLKKFEPYMESLQKLVMDVAQAVVLNPLVFYKDLKHIYLDLDPSGVLPYSDIGATSGEMARMVIHG